MAQKLLVLRGKMRFYSELAKMTNNRFLTFSQIIKNIQKNMRAPNVYDVGQTLNKESNFSKTAWNIINNL